MKKMIFLPIAICIFLIQNVLAAPAEAVFSTTFKEKIQVVVDGQIVNRYPERNVYIIGRPGMHSVQIHVFNQWGRIKFTHHDRIHFHPHSQHQFLLEVDPYRGSRLIHLKNSHTPQYRRRLPQAPPAPYYPRHAPLKLMSDNDYFLLQERLSSQPNDQKRMMLAKRALKNSLITSEDVKELLYLFNFEDSRLAFAKLAYARTSDPENFSLVYEAFQHPSSIRQLEAFIQSRH